MSWLSDRLRSLLAQRSLTVESVARSLAIERSHLTLIIADSRDPNENLIKRMAGFFGEDPAEWLSHAQQATPTAEPAQPAPAGFVTVAQVSDVGPGELKIVADGQAVIANVDGQLYAFGNVCPHAGGDLGDGFLDDDVVECPWHAGRWNVRTGLALTVLASDDIQTYDLRVVGDQVEIKLDPRSAQP